MHTFELAESTLQMFSKANTCAFKLYKWVANDFLNHNGYIEDYGATKYKMILILIKSFDVFDNLNNGESIKLFYILQCFTGERKY